MAGSINSAYTTFGAVLSKNLVALYLSAIYNSGVDGQIVNWKVTSPIINTTHFQIRVVVQPGYSIHLLRFSIVALDIADV